MSRAYNRKRLCCRSRLGYSQLCHWGYMFWQTNNEPPVWHYFLKETNQIFSIKLLILGSSFLEGPAVCSHKNRILLQVRVSFSCLKCLSLHHYQVVYRVPDPQAWHPASILLSFYTVSSYRTYLTAKEAQQWVHDHGIPELYHRPHNLVAAYLTEH